MPRWIADALWASVPVFIVASLTPPGVGTCPAAEAAPSTVAGRVAAPRAGGAEVREVRLVDAEDRVVAAGTAGADGTYCISKSPPEEGGPYRICAVFVPPPTATNAVQVTVADGTGEVVERGLADGQGVFCSAEPIRSGSPRTLCADDTCVSAHPSRLECSAALAMLGAPVPAGAESAAESGGLGANITTTQALVGIGITSAVGASAIVGGVEASGDGPASPAR